MGTGAFTTVTANRNIDVAVSNDASAYLGLSGTGGANADYVTDDGSSGTLSIDLDSGQSVAGGGEGVNPNALTEIDFVFEIANQGTQEVDVSLAKSGANSGLIGFYATPDATAADPYSSGTQLSANAVTLAPGESVVVSLQIDTRGSGLTDSDQILDAVTISATA